MLKKSFGLIGVGIFSPVLLYAVLMSSFVTNVSSPQAEFAALSDEAMAQLIGGTNYTKGNIIQRQEGKFAPCNYPSKCPTQRFTFKPTIYSCFRCYSRSQTQHYKGRVPREIISWCDNSVSTECPYNSSTSHERDDCETSMGHACGRGGG